MRRRGGTHGELSSSKALGEAETLHRELEGFRILLVEDEPVIALDLAHMIGAAGGVVIGPVHTVARALALIDCTVIDAAILDYRLETENARSIADRLSKTGVPFLFYTSSRDEAELTYPTVPILAKPTGRIELVSAMQRLLEGRQRR